MIALITAGGTGLCIIFGHQVFQVLPSQIAIILGAACLIVMGVWVIWQEMAGHNPKDQVTTLSNDAQDLHKESLARRMLLILKNPFLADQDASGHIDLRESLLLSLALMLNNIPNGVGAGLLGMSALFTTLMVGLLSILTFWLGIGLGRSVGIRWLGRHAGTVSGLLLIVIGLAEIILSLPL
jgi:putative sporulation protein YtaF